MTLLQNDGTAAAPVGAGDLIKETTTKDFMADVIEASKTQPVLVDFWAEWCGPCKQLTPVIEKVIRAAKGKAKLVKMNIDHHPQVSQQMGIQSIPAVIAFVNGQPIDGFMGALPEGQVTAFVERLIKDRVGGEEKDMLAAAEAALASGDAGGAAELYAALLQQEPDNVVALAGLARCQVASDAIEEAKQTLAMVPPAKQNDPAVAAARAALDLAEQAATLGPLTELEGKVAANPLDHQARFDLAVALSSAGQRAQAVDHLIEVVRRDRKWNDDGARKQLVQFFEAWGPMDEATIEGRRRLSSILFA